MPSARTSMRGAALVVPVVGIRHPERIQVVRPPRLEPARFETDPASNWVRLGLSSFIEMSCAREAATTSRLRPLATRGFYRMSDDHGREPPGDRQQALLLLEPARLARASTSPGLDVVGAGHPAARRHHPRKCAPPAPTGPGPLSRARGQPGLGDAGHLPNIAPSCIRRSGRMTRAARTHARAISAEMHAGFAGLRQSTCRWTSCAPTSPAQGRTPEALADIARVAGALDANPCGSFGDGGPLPVRSRA